MFQSPSLDVLLGSQNALLSSLTSKKTDQQAEEEEDQVAAFVLSQHTEKVPLGEISHMVRRCNSTALSTIQKDAVRRKTFENTKRVLAQVTMDFDELKVEHEQLTQQLAQITAQVHDQIKFRASQALLESANAEVKQME
eukprot:TRINITY_DN67314_c5_g19_i1.p2 TRINITY_DN67314_c5_g19~~TRINITY_DN67314_c5_g19_i1.p2  ORF type:complete len:139 (+),score=17.97 TRINITY_DN67314_c5_g19_i1:57-473(+)